MEKEQEEVVMVVPKVRAASVPSNYKQEDSLLNKEKFTEHELERLFNILGHYLEEE